MWKAIPDTQERYLVNELGEIKHSKSGRLIKSKPKKNSGSLECFSIYVSKGKHKNIYVHRIVAQVFVPNPQNKPEVHHINGIKTDNSSKNLRWCTHKEICQLRIVNTLPLKTTLRSVQQLQTLAKALWGEDWKRHLQEMVVADDPIKYLRDNLES